MLSYLDYAASISLSGTCPSVQLFQPCFLCWCFKLFSQFSSIFSSMIPSEESYWWSWMHPGPTTHFFPLLSFWRTNVLVGTTLCRSMFAHGNMLAKETRVFQLELVFAKRLVFCYFFPFLHVVLVLPISWKSFFILIRVHEACTFYLMYEWESIRRHSSYSKGTYTWQDKAGE